MKADVKLAADVDEPQLGGFKVIRADTPRTINNVHQVIYSCAAPWAHTEIHAKKNFQINSKLPSCHTTLVVQCVYFLNSTL